MNSERFQTEKANFLNQIDELRYQVEIVSFDDFRKACKKYHAEEDPMGVALYDLFYSQLINTLYANI